MEPLSIGLIAVRSKAGVNRRLEFELGAWFEGFARGHNESDEWLATLSKER
jgi:hypothetical protein